MLKNSKGIYKWYQYLNLLGGTELDIPSETWLQLYFYFMFLHIFFLK